MIKKPENKEDLNENKSQEIPVDEPTHENESVKVDFMSEESASSFSSQQTKASKDTIDPNTSADEIKKQVEDYENSKSGKLEYKDLLQYAVWIINTVDVAFSTALNWFAKDSSVTAYSIPEANKKILSQQLAMILSKYQSKFKIEFVFLIGLVVMYSAPVIAAVENRKQKKIQAKRSSKIENEKTPDKPFYRHEPPTMAEANKEEKPEQKEKEVPTVDNVELPVKKRGPRKKYAS